jgi:hypothetical protein
VSGDDTGAIGEPAYVDEPAEKSHVARRRRPGWQKALLGLCIAAAVLAVLGALLYFLGGMGSSANDPAMKREYERMVAAGQVQPVQRKFVIRIPGCVCHSTDPVETETHRYYRISECSQPGCHSSR